MELYHLHLLDNHDNIYKEGNELLIDNTFNNRIYHRIYDMNTTVDVSKYAQMVAFINNYYRRNNLPTYSEKINLAEIIELWQLFEGFSTTNLMNMLQDAKTLIIKESINLREMAMEEYRKENCNDKPSRLHSLFGCSKEGIDFWISAILDNDIDIYRIETLDEPFRSNESLLPNEMLSYGDKIKNAYRYFNPKPEELDPENDEYLIQGKVKILEKVEEVRRHI